MPEVGIIGAGTMGHGIAQCFAVKGWQARLYDVNREILGTVPARIRSNEEVVSLLAVLGKEPVRVLRDVPGFVGNRMQHALQREAMNLVDQGIAAPEEVDRVVKFGFGLRLALMGPLERSDWGGLDITYQVQKYLLPYLCNDTTPSTLLTQKVVDGELGAKTGRGWFDWPEEKKARAIKERDRKLMELIRLTHQG